MTNVYTDDATQVGWTLPGSNWNLMATDITYSKNFINGLTVTTANINTAVNYVNALTSTTAQLNYLNTATSNVQTQLNSIYDDANYIPVITELTTNATLAATDMNSYVPVNASSEVTITLPNSMTIGQSVIIACVSTSTVVLAASGTIQSKNSARRLAGQYTVATALYKSSNTWVVFGDLS